ncbi:MAG: EAL domain-containing protein [Bradyrhizobium sp.]|nr:MAG: EAL domain-containing protein [Bradyrhizobium sp.]
MPAKRERHSGVAPGDSVLSDLIRVAAAAQSAAADERDAEIERLRSEAQRHQAAIEALPLGLCVFDAQKRVVFFNQRLLELYHFDPATMKPGIHWREVIELRAAAGTSPVSAEAYLATHQPMARGEEAREWRETLPDGRTMLVRRQGTAEGGWVSLHEDITEQRDQRAIASERISLQTLIDQVPDNLWVKDVESRFVIANIATANRMGFESCGALIGKTDLELCPPERALQYIADEQKVVQTGQPMFDKEEASALGEKTWILTTKVPLRDSDGRIFGVVGVSRDITDRRLASSLRDGQAQILEMIAMSAPLEAVLDSLVRLVESQLSGILASVLMLDEDGRRLRHGAAPSLAAEYVGAIDGVEIGPSVGSCGTAAFTRQPVVVTDIASDPLWRDYRHLAARFDYRSCWSMPILSDRGATLAVFAMYSKSVRSPTPAETRLLEMAAHIAGIAIARIRAEERIQFMASHDALTGLPNRARLGERLSEALASAARRGAWVCVAYVDFDNFKLVNDSLGHNAGDRLLQIMAERMNAALGPNNIVARLGGDEFVILLTNPPKNIDTITAAISRVRYAIAEPIEIEGRSFRITGSFGVSLYPSDGETGETLLANADAAMYRAKESGGDSLVVYSPEINSTLRERVTLLNELRKADPTRDFVLHYQPQVDLRSGRVFAVEALIRWRHERLGLVPPGKFIPLAEESGFIAPLGAWALREACRQTKAWHKAGRPRISMSVNVSARQFREDRIVGDVAEALRQSGLEPKYLELELTESLIMEDVDRAIETMKRLRALGVRLSIDDFGTGYSSLSSLKRFPVERLKIDKSFIQDLPQDEDDRAVATAIISLGQKLNLRVIAEGVETEAQVAFLRENHCDELQGFHFSRPVPADEAAALLSNRLAAPAPAKKRASLRRTRHGRRAPPSRR